MERHQGNAKLDSTARRRSKSLQPPAWYQVCTNCYLHQLPVLSWGIIVCSSTMSIHIILR